MSSCKDRAFKVLALIDEAPRSYTELVHLTKQTEDAIRGTLRAAQAAKLIEPRGHRAPPTGRGRSQMLFVRVVR